jgi:5'-deoxynucleotidase YfbR-like HD superfamily hydrolase
MSDQQERTDWFVTMSGRRMFVLEPDPEQIAIEDIACALSNICRFGGMTRSFYSVAQHSVMVSRLVPPRDALTGLLHDATEAYLGDVISPLKRTLRSTYGRTESLWWSAICKRFPVPAVLPDSVKHADIRALLTEREHLLPRHQWAWVEDEPGYELTAWHDPLSPVEAQAEFLARFVELTKHLEVTEAAQ